MVNMLMLTLSMMLTHRIVLAIVWFAYFAKYNGKHILDPPSWSHGYNQGRVFGGHVSFIFVGG